MINSIKIGGSLVRDPDLNTSKNGLAYCKFTVLVPKRKGGSYFNCIAFGDTASKIGRDGYAAGTNVIVTGRMEENGYTDQRTNQRKYSWQLIVDTDGVSLDDSAPQASAEDAWTAAISSDDGELPF